MLRLLTVASYSENGSDLEDSLITWNPLVQESKKEIADREKVEADTDKVYLDSEIINKDDLRRKLKNSNTRYSFLEVDNEAK